MTRHGRTTAPLVAIAALLAGCGGDDDPIDGNPPVTFTTQPTAGPPSDGSAVAPTAAPVDPSTGVPPSPAPAARLGDPVVALAPIGTLDQPVDLASRADDVTLFVVGQGGIIVPVRGDRFGEPVLDITDLTESSGERGLLGLTFSPDGATAYVNHTDNAGDTIVAAYAVDGSGVFDEDSRVVLLTIDQPYANHNGGNVTIGPDGMLYIGMGDGGSGGDPERRALDITTLLGKILRIDPTPTADSPYTVPADNPFVDVEGARPEIWSVGVRNPWRMSFDPATGDLWFGDVGQGELEEIDVAWAADGAGRGANFGWSAFEGTRRYNDDQSPDGATPPVFEYEHGEAGCSVSGGAVYRGTVIPALAGWYVFGDYCSGRVVGLRAEDRVVTGNLVLGEQSSITAVRAGPDGELYVLSLDGTVSRIVAA